MSAVNKDLKEIKLRLDRQEVIIGWPLANLVSNKSTIFFYFVKMFTTIYVALLKCIVAIILVLACLGH